MVCHFRSHHTAKYYFYKKLRIINFKNNSIRGKRQMVKACRNAVMSDMCRRYVLL